MKDEIKIIELWVYLKQDAEDNAFEIYCEGGFINIKKLAELIAQFETVSEALAFFKGYEQKKEEVNIYENSRIENIK